MTFFFLRTGTTIRPGRNLVILHSLSSISSVWLTLIRFLLLAPNQCVRPSSLPVPGLLVRVSGVGLAAAVQCTWKLFGLVKSGLSAFEGFASSFSTNDLAFDFSIAVVPFNLLTLLQPGRRRSEIVLRYL